MYENIKIVGISGSLRANSYNTYLLHAAAGLMPEGVLYETASIADLPMYNQDLDIPAAEKRPESVEAFRSLLSSADGIVIASPEYNYSIPGGLKNAIDWASRGADSPLLNKPVALLGATPGMAGTVRMQLAFLPVFQFLNMKPVHKPEVLVANCIQKFSDEGKLVDETALKLIQQKLSGLLSSIQK